MVGSDVRRRGDKVVALPRVYISCFAQYVYAGISGSQDERACMQASGSSLLPLFSASLAGLMFAAS